MSYILDALKKAEADRDPDARARLAIAQHERKRNRFLAYGIIAALIANAAILLWLFFPAPEPAPDSAPALTRPEPGLPPPPMQPSRIVSAPVQSGASPVREAMAPPAPVRETSPTLPSGPGTQQASGMTTRTATGDTLIGPGSSGLPAQRPTSAGEPVSLSSLPMEQQRRFPGLAFSTHIYAEEADLRAIVVNGIRLKEGDRVENLRLEEITEEGAVFAFENQLVSVSVLETWN